MSTGNETVATEDVIGQQQQAPILASSAAPPHAVSEHDSDALVQRPIGRFTLGTLCAVALVAAIAWDLHVRSASESAVADATQAAAILSVNVVHPV